MDPSQSRRSWTDPSNWPTSTRPIRTSKQTSWSHSPTRTACSSPTTSFPIVSKKIDDKAAAALNKVSAALSAEDLVNLNSQSVNDQLSATKIAADWLKQANLF